MFKFIFILSLFIFPNITLADLPQNYKRLMDQYGFNESTFGFVIQNLSEKDISPIKHNIEKPFNTAIREGYEELNGFLGNEKELALLVK